MFYFLDPNKMTQISTFKGIIVKPGSAVFVDIDDTIFDYGDFIDDYWKQKIVDPEYKIWFDIMKSINPKITDNHFYDFIEYIKNNGSTIFLITARNFNFRHITKEHLKNHKLDHLETHHLSGSSKSEYIRSNFDLSSYSSKIFIDDSIDNINDINQNLEDFDTYIFKKNINTNNIDDTCKKMSEY